MNLEPNFKSMLERWPSTYVAREKVEEFTGGIVSARYLANLDSLGKGPKWRVRVGRKVAYPVSELVSWIESRTVII